MADTDREQVILGGWAVSSTPQRIVTQGYEAEPQARLTQEYLEAVVSPPINARLTAASAEVIVEPSAAAHLTQQFLEVIVIPRTQTGFDDCGTWLGARECEVRVYNGDEIRAFTEFEDWLDSVEWEQLERGGCGTGSVSALAAWEDLQFVGNERVDIYLFDQPAYRGWARVASKEIANPERAKLTLYGLMEVFDHWTVTRKFAYGCATDIGDLFRELIGHVLTPARQAEISVTGASLSVSAETIGITIQEFDARGSSLAQALNQICDLAPNLCIWGCDFAASSDWRGRRENRVYLRNRNTTPASVYAIGDNVTAYTYPQDVSRVVNRLRLTGGKAVQPNLALNGSFEDVVPASEVVGNLLLNPGFEDVDANWSVGGGDPTVMTYGDPGAMGQGHGGTHWLELDTPGEAKTQTVAIQPGGSYSAAAWARLEDPDQTNAFRVYIQGLDASDNQVTNDYVQATLTDANYVRQVVSKDWALYPTVTKARIRVESISGTHTNDGVLVDDCGIFETCATVQQYWHAIPTGSATIDELEWDCSGPVAPLHGGLCVRIKVADIGGSPDTGELYYLPSESPSVQPNERYTMVVRWHTNGIGGGSDNALSFSAVNIKSDNTAGTRIESETFKGAPAYWQTSKFDITTESTAVRLQLFILSRTTRSLYIDGVMLLQGEAPDEVLNDRGWWDGETYEAVIDVTDGDLMGLSAGAAASITTYGEREATATVDQVTDRDTLLTYAAPYFNGHAVPEFKGSISVEGPQALLPQTGTVKLINLPDGPQALFPSRIHYQVGDSIQVEADLGSETPDMADLLNMTATRARLGP